jgi:hypothetical protein
MLSDDYRAVNYKGIVSTKENEIATAREDRTYEALTGDVMSVSVFGESANASGLIQASCTIASCSGSRTTLFAMPMTPGCGAGYFH